MHLGHLCEIVVPPPGACCSARPSGNIPATLNNLCMFSLMDLETVLSEVEVVAMVLVLARAFEVSAQGSFKAKWSVGGMCVFREIERRK